MDREGGPTQSATVECWARDVKDMTTAGVTKFAAKCCLDFGLERSAADRHRICPDFAMLRPEISRTSTSPIRMTLEELEVLKV